MCGEFVPLVVFGLLERARKRITEAPDGARFELLMLRQEVVGVDTLEQPDRELGLGEGAVDQRLRRRDGQHLVPHEVHAPPEGLPAPLDAVYADGERVDQVEVLAVLGAHRFEVARERHVRADGDAVAGHQPEPHTLVMCVTDADAEGDALVLGVDLKEADQAVAVLGDAVFFLGDLDVPEREGFFEAGDELVMRVGFEGVGGFRGCELRKFFARDFSCSAR